MFRSNVHREATGSTGENESSELSPVDTCDCTSYCYFTLAVVLFSIGTIITILALNSENSFSNLGHMWLVGPIFISSGLMVAIKTIIYLRKKTMIAFLERQRSFLRDLNCDSWDDTLPRNTNTLAFPPSYDAVVGNNTAQSNTWLLHSDTLQDPSCYSRNQQFSDPPSYRSQDCQDPPPSYEEAMLLFDPSNSSSILEQSDCNQDNPAQESEGQLNSRNVQRLSKDT